MQTGCFVGFGLKGGAAIPLLFRRERVMSVVYLSEPGCAAGCPRCVRKCAVLQIHLTLWEERELAILRACRAVPVVPDRLRAQRAEAEATLRRLRQDIELAQEGLPLWVRSASARQTLRAASLQ